MYWLQLERITVTAVIKTFLKENKESGNKYYCVLFLELGFYLFEEEAKREISGTYTYRGLTD